MREGGVKVDAAACSVCACTCHSGLCAILSLFPSLAVQCHMDVCGLLRGCVLYANWSGWFLRNC